MKVIIAGGGTAGHAYPGVSLAGVLSDRGVEVTFIGTPLGPEAKLARKLGYAFEPIEIVGRAGGIKLHNLKAGMMLAGATWRTVVLLAKLDPAVVVVTGGYVSLPVALAATLHRIHLVVHEQNVIPGLANRIASRFASAVAVSFPGSEAQFGIRARLTGNPVRPEISGLDSTTARAEAVLTFDLAPARRTVLITGGSQGARSINDSALRLYDVWRVSESLQVLHLTGARNFENVTEKIEALRGADDRIVWRLLPYTDRMELAYAAADLALSRAGATTVSELAATAVPAILVPYPYAVDDDQLRNAEAAAAAGGAMLIPDAELDASTLAASVEELLDDGPRLARMGSAMATLSIPNAADRLADLVLEVAGGGQPAASRMGTIKDEAGEANLLGLPWRRAHLVGIGGAGMSAIAKVLSEAGVRVTGSDVSDSAVLEGLRSKGFAVHIGHRAQHVGGVGVVIVSDAVPETNVEVAAARVAGIDVLSRGEAVARIVSGRLAIAVSGTHGKTTTSGMIATILSNAGLDPTYLLGADPFGAEPGGKLGSTEFAVVEADEAYGSHLLLEPEIAVVTNVDLDHLDYYGTPEAIQEAFVRFAGRAKQLIVCVDDARAASLEHSDRTTYGITEDALVTARELVHLVGGSRFDLVIADRRVGEVELQIGGRRNVQNALGAAAVCVVLGLDGETICRGLSAFKGVSRRFEYRGSVGGADLVDDYAHHPTEIEATLDDARWGPWERIVAVFQPHLYSRTQSLWREFGSALTKADLVVITDVYGAREDPLPGVTGKLVAEAACEAAPSKRVAYLPGLGEAAQFVGALIRPGDLVLSLGAGDITTFPDRLVDRRDEHA